MAEINHAVGIKASPQSIYEALTQIEKLSKWWTTDTRGVAHQLKGKIEFRFDGGGPDFQVIGLKPGKLVKWKSKDRKGEWVGTEISFKLEKDEEADQTLLYFKHSKWKKATTFMSHCSTKWAVFMLSLKDYLETGTGKPFPNDTPINHS